MTAFTSLSTLTTIANDDWLLVHDLSATTDKKIARSDLLGASSTWTPSLAFGGSTTGIAYTNRWGIYTQTGSTLTIAALLYLSSKGSQTGAAKIFGLPVNVRTGYAGTVQFIWFSMTSSLIAMSGLISGTDGSIEMYGATAAAASLSALTDGAFANASLIYLSGTYLV